LGPCRRIGGNTIFSSRQAGLNKLLMSPALWVAAAVGSLSILSFSVEALFAVLVIIGLIHLLKGQRVDDDAAKIVLLGLAVLVLSRLPSLLIVDNPWLELKRLATLGHFLLAGLVLLALRGASMERWRATLLVVFFSMLIWAAVILPKVVVFDATLGHIVFSHAQIDAYGKVGQNRLVASTILGSLILATLVFLVRYFNDLKVLHRWLLSICWCIGFSTLASTQARGPFIAILIVGAFSALVLLLKKRVAVGRMLLIFAALLLICLLLLSAAFERIAVTIKDLELFINSSTLIATPISIRLEMWRASLEALQVKPFFGYGISNAVKAVDALTPFDIANYKHLHNELLDTIVSHGVVGLAGSFFLLFCLLKVAFQWWRSAQWHFGVLLGGFAIYWYICGLSNIAFRQGLLNSFFVIFICVLIVAKQATALGFKKSVV
jgi:O-antigen ligase